MSLQRNKQRNPKRKRAPANNALTAMLPYSPGTPMMTLKIDGSVRKYTTTVTTGVIAVSEAVDTGDIASFATRFTGFDECRIIKVTTTVMCCSSANPGSICMWYEPKSSTTPNSTLAASNKVVQFPAGGNSRTYSVSYTPNDMAYLNWITVGTTNFPVGYFNIYTDNATFASSVVATDYCTARATYTIQFRGYS